MIDLNGAARRFALALGASLCVATANASLVVGLSAPTGTSAAIGSTVSIQVSVSGLTADPGSAVGLFDLDIVHSSSLQFVGGTFGSAASGFNPLDLPEAGAFAFIGGISDLGGVLDVFALSGNSQAVLDASQPDAFVLLELTFEALVADALAFVEIDLSDPFLLIGSGDPFVDLAPTFDPARLALSLDDASQQVPEPSTLALVVLGALAMRKVRRPRTIGKETASCA